MILFRVKTLTVLTMNSSDDFCFLLSDVNATDMIIYNFTSSERKCPHCHESCEKGCWGDGPENCQKFSKTNYYRNVLRQDALEQTLVNAVMQ